MGLPLNSRICKYLTYLAITGFLSAMTLSNSVYGNPLSQQTFPHRGIVTLQKEFWKLIFGQYGYNTVVIHDSLDVRNIIDIIPFDALSKKLSKNGKVRSFSQKEKRVWSKKYLARYKQAAKRISSQGKAAIKYGAMEKRIYQIYRKSKLSWNRLRQGKYQLRTQSGHADGFIRAAVIAQDYLPLMEKIFRKYQVPAVLTRLGFVESMFNINALSKVGAKGVFQFMKATALKYMVVNPFFDERRSPLKAARGAAKLLRDNYRMLKSWPLAITAYNHGASGMKNAVHQLGTKDMAVIAARYKSKTFGFASRNFYSEFLAAAEVYQELIETGKVKIKNSKYDQISVLRIKNPISLEKLIEVSNLDFNSLKAFNPCITDNAIMDMESAIFPSNYQLLVPKHKINSAKKSLKHFSNLNGT